MPRFGFPPDYRGTTKPKSDNVSGRTGRNVIDPRLDRQSGELLIDKPRASAFLILS